MSDLWVRDRIIGRVLCRLCLALDISTGIDCRISCQIRKVDGASRREEDSSRVSIRA